MALEDIVYEASDAFVLEVAGANNPINDILFAPTACVIEVTGANGPATDVLFAPSMTYEIPKVLITDFAFL